MSRIGIALRAIVFPMMFVIIIFIAAGRWDLPFVWSIGGLMCALYLALAMFGPSESKRERQALPSLNRNWLPGLFGMACLLAHWVFAGLDIGRLEWSPVIWEIQFAGAIGHALSIGISFWAMLANPYYNFPSASNTITHGPYRFVRHPGYAATLTALFCGGLALGSWLAIIPLLGFANLFLRRILLEDRRLHEDLDGYPEYAAKVRYRLIPGVF